MAKGPNTQLKQERLEALEKRIDAILESKCGSVTISAEFLGIGSHEVDALKPRYTHVGWKNVEYVSDQRDGDFIRFEA